MLRTRSSIGRGSTLGLFCLLLRNWMGQAPPLREIASGRLPSFARWTPARASLHQHLNQLGTVSIRENRL